GKALAEKCQRILDERTRYAAWVFEIQIYDYNARGAILGWPLSVAWFGGSGWQDRNEALFEAAAEVAAALGTK
ncbi:MAG: hypothetical protein N3A38_17470, partial [Planctomycetota bacterium]|nr:hypothetical protein [Planctomycetota bacterium]